MSDRCPNCGETLKLGMMSSNQAFTPPMLQALSLASGHVMDAACNRCGDEALTDAKRSLRTESATLTRAVLAILPEVPIASIHSPFGWEYDVVGVITAQSVTGTGIFSDVASTFTDLFGSQSGTYNAKLREGENLCKASLRAQAIEAGANAILAADIDYAEVGGQRAMLMVCMTGTAVVLINTDCIAEGFGDRVADATQKARRVRKIEGVLSAL